MATKSNRLNIRAFLLPASLVLIGLLLGLLICKLVVSNTPKSNSAEAGFARDMVTHHRQAVEMALIIRTKSVSDDVSTLAYDIANTQGPQGGMLIGWLQQWKLPQTTSDAPMSWMNMSHGSMDHGSDKSTTTMPGMATDEELTALRNAEGVDAEKQFLRLMIKHHEGGVTMANGILALTKQPDVRSLAQTIVSGQQAEIDLMNSLLKRLEG